MRSITTPIETNIIKRWEKEIKHNPQSKELVRAVAELDLKYGGNGLGLKRGMGGYGDNGEHLMYLLDIYFEQREEAQYRRQSEFYKEQREKCLRLTRVLDKK